MGLYLRDFELVVGYKVEEEHVTGLARKKKVYRDPYEAYQCQPMNEDYYHEQNSCYDPNSFVFDQFLPSRYTVNHLIFNAQNDLFNSQNKLMEQLTSMCHMVGQYIQKKEEEKQIKEEQVDKTRYWKIPVCYDDDDDDYIIAITHKEPDNSLSIGDEHLDTIPATESNEFIKSSVENLVPNPSESEGEHKCIDSLFDEFAGELTLLKSILPGINETDCDPEEEIRLIKIFLIVTLLWKKNDLSFTLDDPLPSGIEEDDYDSERDILILEEFLSNNSLSLPENESFHFDIPTSSRPPAKPPDGNTRILNVKVMGVISKNNVPFPRLMTTLVPNQEKSPNLLFHQGNEAFQPSTECPMMIYGKNTPILDVPFFHFYPP
nr:hypothetical protein [Tanacetum cinerariifolium]